MLIGDLKADFVRHNESESVWAVRQGCAQWSAWVNWYHAEFGKTYFTEWLTVLFEWPPTSQHGADSVAKWLSDIRDGKFQKDPFTIGGKPVPRHPSPWNGGKALPPSPPCTFPSHRGDDDIPISAERAREITARLGGLFKATGAHPPTAPRWR